MFAGTRRRARPLAARLATRHVPGVAATAIAVAGLAAALLTVPGTVRATTPGGNGLLAFSRLAGGDAEIAVARPDGSDLRLLTRNRVSDLSPNWSPDGRRIAFASNRRAPLDFDIWAMRADGSRPTRITLSRAAEMDPSWSPDGTRIAFVSDRARGNLDIWVIRLGGGGVRRLTSDPGPDVDPTWSPDGGRIAFAAERGGDFDIWVINADGSEATRVTGGPADDLAPNWSPDGARIAFERRPGRAGSADVRVVAVDGADTPGPGGRPGDEIAPAFSPDASRIAFQSRRGCRLICPFDVWLMDRDGGRRVRATDGRSRDSTPDWQPIPADLELAATPPAPVLAGAVATASAVVRNIGRGPAFAARVEITPPPGVGVSAASIAGVPCTVAALVICDAGRIRPGRRIVVELGLVAAAPGAYPVELRATTTTFDVQRDNDRATITLTAG